MSYLLILEGGRRLLLEGGAGAILLEEASSPLVVYIDPTAFLVLPVGDADDTDPPPDIDPTMFLILTDAASTGP